MNVERFRNGERFNIEKIWIVNFPNVSALICIEVFYLKYSTKERNIYALRLVRK